MKIAVAELKGTPLESYALELEALAEEMRNQPRGKSVRNLARQMGCVVHKMVEATRGAENEQ